MLQITNDFKTKAASALLMARENFSGSDGAFAKQWGINSAIYSRLKKGEVDNILSSSQWLQIGRELNVSLADRKWNTARTQVFIDMEEDVTFCQENSKSMIYVDECEIGKTHNAKYFARNRKNCFYVDASQAKTKQALIRLIAKTIGIDHDGKYRDVKDNIKYYLRMLPKPIVMVDEAGDLEYTAFLELKELWNGTEGACAWYMMGADGLREKIEKGMRNKKVGFKELFSRFSGNFSSSVPNGRQEKIAFYRQLVTDVLAVNMTNHNDLEKIVKSCLAMDKSNHIGGLRRAESLLILN